MKVTLSAIREHYQNVVARDDARPTPKWTRRERVETAVALALLEAKEAEEYEALAELRAGQADLDQEGSPEDDYEGELPW